MEYRKHYSDMTSEEKTLIENLIKRRYKLSEHAEKRLKEKHISKKQVQNVIKEHEIIEYHYKELIHKEHRVLLRGKKDILGNNICVVLNIKTGEVITAYKNSFSDNHSTLREEYISDLDVINMVKYNIIKNYIHN